MDLNHHALRRLPLKQVRLPRFRQTGMSTWWVLLRSNQQPAP